MKNFFKKIFSKINLDSKKTRVVLFTALILVVAFFVGKYFYDKYKPSDYTEMSVLVNSHKYALAEQKLHDLLKDNAQDPYFLVLVARTYIGRSDEVADTEVRNNYLTKAIQVLNTAESISPGLVEIYRVKGLAYLYIGDYVNSKVFYKKALSLEPNSTTVLIDLGNLYLTRRDIAGGFEVFSQILKANPDNEQAKVGFIKLYMLQYRYDKAIESGISLYRTTKDEDIKLQLVDVLAHAYLKTGEYKEAKTYFDMLYTQNPNSVLAVYGMAEVTFATEFDLRNISNSVKNAREFALKAINIDPTYPYSYVLLARIALITKDESAYDMYVESAKSALESYHFMTSSEKVDLLKTIPAFGVKQANVTIKQISVSKVSTSTSPNGLIILNK